MKESGHTTETTLTALKADPNTNNVLDFSTTLCELRKTVDPHLVRRRAGRRDNNGNVQMVEYVEWHTVADILDAVAPNWAHTVKDIHSIGEIITVTVAITINGVTREGVGTGRATSETGIKKAEHDALKRAAVKFGIARELYKREFNAIENEDSAVTSIGSRENNVVAQTLGDMISGKQLGMIRAIAREVNIDAEKECYKIMRCRIDELSKRAASELIERLQSLHRRSEVPMRRAS